MTDFGILVSMRVFRLEGQNGDIVPHKYHLGFCIKKRCHAMLEYKALAQPVLYFTKMLSYYVEVMFPVGIK